ncbi:MAG: SIS domain-containing protein [Planctomycetia bacterium]|nr:SIS domain-containing protein [Planctomycetia bacterium]
MSCCSCYQASSNPKEYAREVCDALMQTDFDKMREIAQIILQTKQNGKMIFTAGNGGSASTASHIINDLTKGCRIGNREGFRTMCLNDSNALVTCLANDFCYEDIYRILLKTLGNPGDVLLVFSGSGNSPNILRVCELAREMGITTIGFGGRDGGKMKELCDVTLLAPTYSMEQLEDLHVIYLHSLVCMLKEQLQNAWDVEMVHYPPAGMPLYAACEATFREYWRSQGGTVVDTPSQAIAFAETPQAVADWKAAQAYIVGVSEDRKMREQMVAMGADCVVPNTSNHQRLAKFLRLNE